MRSRLPLVSAVVYGLSATVLGFVLLAATDTASEPTPWPRELSDAAIAFGVPAILLGYISGFVLRKEEAPGEGRFARVGAIVAFATVCGVILANGAVEAILHPGRGNLLMGLAVGSVAGAVAALFGTCVGVGLSSFLAWREPYDMREHEAE